MVALGKIAAYTDASSVLTEEGAVGALGWLALDLEVEDSLVTAHVEAAEEGEEAAVTLNEVLAIVSVARTYREAEELHVFTDCLFAVDQWERGKQGFKRKARICQEELAELLAQENLTLHYVQAHKGFFFNEVCDKMVRQLSERASTPGEATAWARKTCRQGRLEIPFTKKETFRPRLLTRDHAKNDILLREATLKAAALQGAFVLTLERIRGAAAEKRQARAEALLAL